MLIVGGGGKIKHISLKEEKRTVVYMAGGKIRSGGLGDRLRGIISLYMFCEENRLDFRIYFTDPFLLSDYLEPNVVNWLVGDDTISYDRKHVKELSLFDMTRPWRWTMEKQLMYHRRVLCREVLGTRYKQYHVHTNSPIALCQAKEYFRCFHLLFKPSLRLQQAMEVHLSKLGDNFIAMTFRFQQLLGDFTEGDFPTLKKEAAVELIDRNIQKAREIYACHREVTRLLVTSDSQTFLERMRELDYVYTVPGERLHMDHTDRKDYELHLKSFLDLMMLSRAKKIYLLCTGKMYHSGFARAASLIGKVEYEEVLF
jgi:hypothetical protein